MMAAGFAHDDGAFLRKPVETERGEERVQEAGMIAVLHVLHVELPVAGQCLGVVAEEFHRGAHHSANAGEDVGAEILLERRRLTRQRAKDETANGRKTQLARPVLFGAAAAGIPPLPPRPLRKATPVRLPQRS